MKPLRSLRGPRGRALGISAAAVALAACGHHDFEPPDRSERVRRAEAAYAPALFDSVAWGAEEERALAGNQVYVEACRDCHGPLGRGATAYARERGLDVPSLVDETWPLARQDTLRRTIFIGHEDGMPIFGDGKLTPRDIDAVSAYILEVLRPDARTGG